MCLTWDEKLFPERRACAGIENKSGDEEEKDPPHLLFDKQLQAPFKTFRQRTPKNAVSLSFCIEYAFSMS